MKKTAKIFLSMLLVLCMIMPMSTMVFATSGSTPANGVSYFSGKTKDELADVMAAVKADYVDDKQIDIYTADELVAFAYESASTTFSGATVTLKTDIVLNKGDAAYWMYQAPAFAWPGITNFSGTFNGDGHTISGIYMSTTGAIGIGFFNQLNKAATTINNVGFVNSLFTSTTGSYAPAIVGRANTFSLTFNGCYSNTITYTSSTLAAGGFVALTTNSVTTFNNCVFDGTVKSTVGTAVGGFVGRAGMSKSAKSVAYIHIYKYIYN